MRDRFATALDRRRPSLPSDVRGASRLVIDLTLLVTELVETMHHNIARVPGIAGRATFAPTRGLTGLVYRSVRGITRLTGWGIDAALAPLAPLLRDRSVWPGRDAVIATLNGVLGDHLEASDNPLAIPMQLRIGGRALALTAAGISEAIPRPRSRVIVMVHGLCMSDRQWNRQSRDCGQALARDLGADTLYLHYNSGRHISTNGAEFAALLERLAAAWPVPLHELVLVGHSMGGLVIRSACAVAENGSYRWPRRLHALALLGTPHHGAPLERGGQGLDLLLAASPYTAAFTRLGRLRSAGITDLRHGSILDQDWQGHDRFVHRADLRRPQPLPAGVPCFAIAGSLSKAAPTGRRAPRGDGLVPVASALGRHTDPRMSLDFAPAHCMVAYDVGHLDLMSSPAVYAQLRHWLAQSLSDATLTRSTSAPAGAAGGRPPRSARRRSPA